MDDDFDTPGAVAVGFELLREARAASGDTGESLAAAVFDIFENALGLPLHDELSAVPAAVVALGKERDTARAARDWARADAIRAELQEQGWIVEDGPHGTTIRPGPGRV
jgi:cysteinyl-tRNA synthetase